jgi:hypothetical protein
MKEHLSEFKWIYIIVFILLSLITYWVWYEYEYPCVYGHTEEQWQTSWCYNADGSMYSCGGYYQDVFVCDCRTVRDSIK